MRRGVCWQHNSLGEARDLLVLGGIPVVEVHLKLFRGRRCSERRTEQLALLVDAVDAVAHLQRLPCAYARRTEPPPRGHLLRRRVEAPQMVEAVAADGKGGLDAVVEGVRHVARGNLSVAKENWVVRLPRTALAHPAPLPIVIHCVAAFWAIIGLRGEEPNARVVKQGSALHRKLLN
eukprot:7389729-Prymnesium_polylepis.1